jgi:oxygen-independent coproporphyrinogen-3 oxidase
MNSTDNDFSIYIHIPFCKQACSYCDFYFVTRQHLIDDYVKALIEEISNAKSFLASVNPKYIVTHPKKFPRILKTIYFGGGTPSRLKIKHISQILEAIKLQFDFEHVSEITFEVNPDDVSSPYLTDLMRLGINRVSMGIQTFDPGLLTFMNRAHNPEEAVKSLEMVKLAGFESYSVDLIYGNPGQSNEALERDIELLLSFNPPHISAYALTIEPNTRLGKYVEMGRLQPVDDSLVYEHMSIVLDRLENGALCRYEVSNFARIGYESKHNSSYWNHVPYLGFGPGAHSLWFNSDSNNSLIENAIRWENPRDLKEYISVRGNQNNTCIEYISALQLSEERLLMGLRTKDGVSIDELNNRYGYRLSDRQIEWIHRHENQPFVKIERGCIQITSPGLPIADRIILDLVTAN